MTLWARWRQRRYDAIEGRYLTQIASLAPTPDQALRLPAIRALKAKRVKRVTLQAVRRSIG